MRPTIHTPISFESKLPPEGEISTIEILTKNPPLTPFELSIACEVYTPYLFRQIDDDPESK